MFYKKAALKIYTEFALKQQQWSLFKVNLQFRACIFTETFSFFAGNQWILQIFLKNTSARLVPHI